MAKKKKNSAEYNRGQEIVDEVVEEETEETVEEYDVDEDVNALLVAKNSRGIQRKGKDHL